MRSLSNCELGAVIGGDPVVDFLRVIQITTEMGGNIYDSLSEGTQVAIGGTIDAALANAGMKEPEDAVVQDTRGSEE